MIVEGSLCRQGLLMEHWKAVTEKRAGRRKGTLWSKETHWGARDKNCVGIAEIERRECQE